MKQGQVVGRYRVERQIGEGGMGSVWRAQHVTTEKRFALKTLHSQREDIRQRFLREARAACAVEHENVVDVHDVFEAEDGTPVMVMELLHGETLREKLERESVLGEAEALRLLAPVVSAVGTAHRMGIVHRDLKPENVFLTKSGAVKVLDFGVAKLLHASGDHPATESGAVIGTLWYMPPEQAFGDPIDHRADVWALGVMAYEMLAGKRPIQADTHGRLVQALLSPKIEPISSIVPEVSPKLAALCARMLAPDASERCDMTEVAATFIALGQPTARFEVDSDDGRPAGAGASRAKTANAPTTDPHAPTQRDVRQGFAHTAPGDPKRFQRAGLTALVAVAALGTVAYLVNVTSRETRAGNTTSPSTSAVESVPPEASAPPTATAMATATATVLASPSPPVVEPATTSSSRDTAKIRDPNPGARPRPTSSATVAIEASSPPPPPPPSGAPTAKPSGPTGITDKVPF